MARTKKPWTWLRKEEIAKLLGEKVEPEQRCLFAFAIFTGLRVGEIFGLQWADIDYERKTARICRSWRGAPTKRGETREVHLFDAAMAELRRQRARKLKGPLVFPNAQGEPRSKHHKTNIDHWLTLAGVERRVRFHDLRHTCASHLVSGTWGRTWTLEEVAKHLGHSSSAVTRRYAHLCPEGLQRAVQETRPEQKSDFSGRWVRKIELYLASHHFGKGVDVAPGLARSRSGGHPLGSLQSELTQLDRLSQSVRNLGKFTADLNH